MIIFNRGEIKIAGNKAELMADLTCIIRVLKDDAEFTDEEIAEVVESSRKTEDELRAEAHELFKKKFPMVSALFEALDKDLANKEE